MPYIEHVILYKIEFNDERVYIHLLKGSYAYKEAKNEGWSIAILGTKSKCLDFFNYLKKIKSDAKIYKTWFNSRLYLGIDS